MKTLNLFSILFIASLLFVSCGDDEENNTLNLNISGLENLGENYAYEGWIIVDGSPVTTGVFNVDDNGNLSQNSFELESSDLANATAFVLTIEPSPDDDSAPSDVHILAGDFNSSSANLTVDHQAAIGDNFESSTGNYILATPTDGGSTTDEFSGVWFLDPAAGPAAGLDLPTLPTGWIYEGWAVIDGTPVSTGTFRDPAAPDELSIYSGDQAGPPFPGEDFLVNAPAGLNFPTDLRDAVVVISVEPFPDNSPAPFLLKPLVSEVPDNAADHSLLGMSNNAIATNPTGTVTR